MDICRLCKGSKLNIMVDLGMQPICNRFLVHPVDDEYQHRMLIGQCDSCGVIQIIEPVSASELLPNYDWITYQEPEGHLDKLVERISNLPELTRDSSILGLSFKDDSTLSRLKNYGFKHSYRINPNDDLEIRDPRAGIETIQGRMTKDAAIGLIKKYGRFDMVIARHILEHAHDSLAFLISLKQLVKPKGYIVIEVPDCMKAMEKFDYTLFWEEHIVYFTAATFERFFSLSGLSLIHFDSYPYTLEDSLVGIARPLNGPIDKFASCDSSNQEASSAQAYFKELPKYRIKVKSFLREFRNNYGKIALFGAGHFACTFINLLDLRGDIDFVADDNPNKKGLFMPGSRLPILDSGALIDRNIRLCLLGLNPLNEERAVEKNSSFLDRGGKFLSIFRTSKLALPV